MLFGSQQITRSANAEIEFGNFKSVGRTAKGFESLEDVGLIRLSEQTDVTWMHASADSSPQLMQLGQAEPLGSLDAHERGVRHVDSDFDDQRRHQTAEALRGPSPHEHTSYVEASCQWWGVCR